MSGCQPRIVKIGDNRAQAEYARQCYMPVINAATLAQINALIESMPENGPIPYELKALYYTISEIHTISDYSIIYNTVVNGPIIYGVAIDDIIICQIKDTWFILDIGTLFVVYDDNKIIETYKALIGSSTFYYPEYFVCEKKGQYYINDKVFEINGNGDFVYKDQFLVRNLGDSVLIIQPQISTEFTQNRHFTYKLPGFRLDANLTLIANDRYCIAECETQDENLITIYANPDGYENDDASPGFILEKIVYINNVRAVYVSSNDMVTNLEPNKICKIYKLYHKNHYSKIVNRLSIIKYLGNTYVLTEWGLIYEVNKDSGNNTKYAIKTASSDAE